MSKPLPEGRTGRSVVDYKTEEELRIALSAFAVSDDSSGGLASKKADWILPVPDPELEAQTIDGELQRLLTLRSYLMLDAESEVAFDNLTKEACELFQLPISLVTLVDFGRQFMFSKQGLPAKETPRSEAFCAYTILSRKNICVVPDAKLDDRFRANKLVTGPPKLRFYAGASLISPEVSSMLSTVGWIGFCRNIDVNFFY
jgi:GAF domain-containing protein